MALDRWLALVILLVCLAYGYAAWFTMDALLPPIMQRSPVWPSSFPKVLAVGGILLSLGIVLGLEKAPRGRAEATGSPGAHRIAQAVLLPGLMVAYALLLRPFGFLAATFLFLTGGSFILGERRFVVMVLVAATAAGGIWYLVDVGLGIFLSPLPAFMTGGRGA